jgi:hypothetical protein
MNAIISLLPPGCKTAGRPLCMASAAEGSAREGANERGAAAPDAPKEVPLGDEGSAPHEPTAACRHALHRRTARCEALPSSAMGAFSRREKEALQ